jgi:hypothetical protein
MCKIGELQKDVADLCPERTHFLMGSLQEFFEDAELMHDLERRRVNRITAEVTQKIAMLFENEDSDPGSGQQQRQHHPGGAPSDNAAPDRNLAKAHRVAPSAPTLLCLIGASRRLAAPPEGEFSVT